MSVALDNLFVTVIYTKSKVNLESYRFSISLRRRLSTLTVIGWIALAWQAEKEWQSKMNWKDFRIEKM